MFWIFKKSSFKFLADANGIGTVVEPTSYDPTVEGSTPAAADTVRDKMVNEKLVVRQGDY
jgi:hypothetical protein